MRKDWSGLPANIQAAYRSRATRNHNFPIDERPPRWWMGQLQLPLFIVLALAGNTPVFVDYGQLPTHFSINIELPHDTQNNPMAPSDFAGLHVADFPPFYHEENIWYPKLELAKGGCERATLWVKTGETEGDRILDVGCHDCIHATATSSIHCPSQLS